MINVANEAAEKKGEGFRNFNCFALLNNIFIVARRSEMDLDRQRINLRCS